MGQESIINCETREILERKKHVGRVRNTRVKWAISNSSSTRQISEEVFMFMVLELNFRDPNPILGTSQ